MLDNLLRLFEYEASSCNHRALLYFFVRNSYWVKHFLLLDYLRSLLQMW